MLWSIDKVISPFLSLHCVFSRVWQSRVLQFGIFLQSTLCCHIFGDDQALKFPFQLPFSSLLHLMHPTFVYAHSGTFVSTVDSTLALSASSLIFLSFFFPRIYFFSIISVIRFSSFFLYKTTKISFSTLFCLFNSSYFGVENFNGGVSSNHGACRRRFAIIRRCRSRNGNGRNRTGLATCSF